LLLAATVRSFAHMPPPQSQQNKKEVEAQGKRMKKDV